MAPLPVNAWGEGKGKAEVDLLHDLWEIWLTHRLPASSEVSDGSSPWRGGTKLLRLSYARSATHQITNTRLNFRSVSV